MVSQLLPFVSVIIPIYNGEEDLPDLLKCLKGQTYPRDRVEYLIVDNGSQDTTWEILQNTPGITALQENQIQGSYAARNQGIIHAQGSILAFTDADCRPEPQWLMELIAGFNQPNIGLVIGEIQALPGNTLLERYAERQETLSQKHTIAHSFCPYGQTANVAIQASIFQEINLFRPYLTTGGDADICWRLLQETKWQWHFAENGIVRHRHRRTLKELTSQWRRYGRSNQYLHDIHGIKLMPQPTTKLYADRLIRWALKELPLVILKTPLGKAELIDWISTPIGLICLNARWQGQQQAQLPDNAKDITSWPHPQKANITLENVTTGRV